MESLTFNQLIGACAVMLIFITAYNTIMTAVKKHRSEKERADKPVKDLEDRLEKYDKYFAADDKRFEKIEADLLANKHENQLMMKMQLALVRHAIDGNNIAGLKQIRDEMNLYLIEK